MPRISLIASAIAAAGLLVCGHAEAVQRSFVASFGSDANTAGNCTFANPCRSFTAAQTVTDSGGEIIALDAAGYGAITITKSLSLIANPGFYAGISASSGNAITIATASIHVTLRGLNLNGVGAAHGIYLTNGASLTVENCEISGFSANGMNLFNDNGVALRVVNTIVRNNGNNAIRLDGGVTADISGSKLIGNQWTALVALRSGTADTTVSVSDTIISGNPYGVAVATGGRAAIIRSSITNSVNFGVDNGGGTISIGYSLVSGNGIGLNNSSGTFESQGNNLIRQNGTATAGTITIVGGG